MMTICFGIAGLGFFIQTSTVPENGKDNLHAPFDGAMDFDYVAGEIAKSGYQGTLMLEPSKLSRFQGVPAYDEMTVEKYCRRAAASLNKLKATIERYRSIN